MVIVTFLPVFFFLGIFPWQAVAGMPTYPNIKPLLIKAIDAPDGTVSGIVSGPMAGFFRQTTGSQHPVIATVTTLAEFDQPGCKRLNLHLNQAGAQTKSGEPKDFDVSYGINLCRDGDAPAKQSQMLGN
ncbi:MAG: hypothetical protein RI993_2048 [Pseudomonadota bacterium]|jgi:hypothetical protein